MKFQLLGTIGASRGTVGRSPRAVAADEVRDARVAVAKRNWLELQETGLVARGLGLLIDAETDLVYVRCRGSIFESGSARLIDERPLAFYLDRDGWPVVLERQGGTWSEVVRAKALRGVVA
jgi:hypothetical protein